MGCSIFRRDVPGYLKKNTVNILKLELTRYGIFRPKINGTWAGYRGPTRHHHLMGPHNSPDHACYEPRLFTFRLALHFTT